MVAYNFGAPAINFAPLGQLGETYDRSVKRTHAAEIAQKREAALAGFGQNGDLAALGKTLLQAGDLEGGLQALRLAEAGQGTPWQREQAAKEAQRYEQTRADNQAERDRQEAARNRDDARQDRLQPYVGANEFQEPRHGLRDPVTGDIFWPDGTTTPGPKRGAPAPVVGPQSSLPAPEGSTTQAQLGAPQPGSTAERGFVIPGTLEGFPHGTTRLAGNPNEPAPLSSEAQATLPAPALAPPAAAGQVAVAAPAAATPPVTATMINQGTSAIAPMSNAEMIAEARRIGVSPKQYRDARAAAIQKEMEAKAVGGEKVTKEQADARAAAGKMEGAEKDFRPNEADTISVLERVKSEIAPGRSENFITSTKYQLGVAAKKEWIAGLLRKESGAAVTPSEFEYYNAIYFPEVGQGGEVALQKAKARERALLGVRAGMTAQQIVELNRTGGGVPPPPGQGAPAAPAGPAAPAVPENAKTAPNGIRFW